MLPFQRTFISSYPKATQDTHRPITAVTRDLGIRLNLKMVLYLENLCLTEKPRIFNPKPRVAPRRWQQG
jgi:hypothetical protein